MVIMIMIIMLITILILIALMHTYAFKCTPGRKTKKQRSGSDGEE